MGVSEATILRDVRAILRHGCREPCPTCGLARLTDEDWEQLDAAIEDATVSEER